MSFIRRISNFIPITVSQESQTEVPPQPPVQPRTSFGVANDTDLFETANAYNSYLIDPQSQPAELIQPSTTLDTTVEASSLFSSFEMNQQFDNTLPQLNDKLNSLEEKRQEFVTKIEHEHTEGKNAQMAAKEIADSIKNDRPISDEILALMGSAGILGIIGGLPAIPIIGGLVGAFAGLSADYKAKAKQAQAELEKKAEQHQMNAEQLKSDLERTDSEIQSTIASIEQEKLRLEREAQPARDQIMDMDAIVQEPVWQEFQPDQNLSQQENISFPVNFDQTFQKKITES